MFGKHFYIRCATIWSDVTNGMTMLFYDTGHPRHPLLLHVSISGPNDSSISISKLEDPKLVTKKKPYQLELALTLSQNPASLAYAKIKTSGLKNIQISLVM